MRRRPLWQSVCLTSIFLFLTIGVFHLRNSPALFSSEPPAPGVPNPIFEAKAPKYVKAILDPADKSFTRLECPSIDAARYGYLQANTTPISTYNPTTLQYVFALNLAQAGHVLPTLLGTLVAAIRFLGPPACLLSVAETASTDGTWEILEALRAPLAAAGIPYLFTHLDHPPASPASARNAALPPLLRHDPERVAQDGSGALVLLDAVAPCVDDVLELLHQRRRQGARLVCAMDWDLPRGRAVGGGVAFAGVAFARSLRGDVFAEQPAGRLFREDEEARVRFEGGVPVPVASCWGGGAVVDVDLFLGREGMGFRGPREGKGGVKGCEIGVEMGLSADLWREEIGRVAVVSSVNLAYSDQAARRIKVEKGYVSRFLSNGAEDDDRDIIKWTTESPKEVRCWDTDDKQAWRSQDWTPWP